MKYVAAILLIFLVGCNECPVLHPWADQTNYTFDRTFVTGTGIEVDDSGLDIDPNLIDQIVNEVEECLYKNFGKNGKIPPEIKENTFCYSKDFDLPIDRKCMKIKIADDCLLNHDRTQELLPVIAPDEACVGKGGEGPSEKFPCRWRSGLQNNLIVVTCPSLYNIKDPIMRMVTGCNNPWFHPLLSECAQPSTDPLSGLVTE